MLEQFVGLVRRKDQADAALVGGLVVVDMDIGGGPEVVIVGGEAHVPRQAGEHHDSFGASNLLQQRFRFRTEYRLHRLLVQHDRHVGLWNSQPELGPHVSASIGLVACRSGWSAIDVSFCYLQYFRNFPSRITVFMPTGVRIGELSAWTA